MPPRVLLCIVAVHTQLECRSSFIPEFFYATALNAYCCQLNSAQALLSKLLIE